MKAWLAGIVSTLFLHFGSMPRLAAESVDRLRAEFVTPPRAARPWTYWFVMDGNFTREGITADLEAMARAGLGGVILMEVDAGMPRGPVRFMSAEWQGLFRHAVVEAQRLGLEMTLNAGPGWTGSGGPWIAPDQSMQHLVFSDTNVIGPAHFDAVLPRPVPRKPFFGEGALPPDLEQSRKAWYEDVVVLAFPTPSGTARIPGVDEKAFYVRAPYSSQPGVKPFFAPLVVPPLLPKEECVAKSGVRDLTSSLSAEGRLVWDVPAGNWTILRFGRASTGQNTRPAPLAGLGLECDKLDPKALDAHFAAFLEPLLRTLTPPSVQGAGWTMLHIDSWEMSAQNWTPKFREEFQRRRGYDAYHYLPVLTGRVVESTDVSERFLWDVRQTIQELIVENHALHLKELGRRNGLGLSIEPYDMNPCADLTLGGAADVPMCEFWAKGFGFNTDFSCFEAVSIAHTLGKPIVASESFTSDGEGWVLYPGALKAQGDWAFCTGINRLVFHRYLHQPWLDRWPGLTMGSIGSHWERTQTWWELVPAYHEYLTRCQALLRRGRPVADICFLVPEGAPNVFRPPPSATRGNPPDHREYTFDACAPEVVRDEMTVNQGRLTLPSGASYALLVLPNFATMTPPLLTKIGQLIRAGATILGGPPVRSPSLSEFPNCDREVSQLAAALWGDISTPERGVGKGRLFSTPGVAEELTVSSNLYPEFSQIAAVLQRMGIVPDVESDVPLRFIHRQESGAEIYFMANPTENRVTTPTLFRISGRQPELWNPLTGKQRPLPMFSTENGRTRLDLRFEPYESYFVVFADAAGAPRGGVNYPEFEPVGTVTGPWTVRFPPGRGAPATITLNALEDWAKHSDPGVRFFSGLASYQAHFQWPTAQAGNVSSNWFIDLGEVQVIADVKLNGVSLGTAWTVPFRVEATRALQPGDNLLEVRVANLWCNRLIGDAGLPTQERITWTTWNPFKPESPLVRSGLLGPVRLLAERSVTGVSRRSAP